MAVVRVGIAESGVVMNPDSISTLGLGSCVGVTLYDEKRRVGGMVHVMLPSTELARERISTGRSSPIPPCRTS